MSRRRHTPITKAELDDALRLLTQIGAPCGGAPNDHGWRTCKRCMALHGIEQRYDVSMRLLRIAIERLALSRDAWRLRERKAQRERETAPAD